jgi:hypothetical protein
MPVIDPQRISDGFISLERGIDAGKAPSMLPRNQASFAVNATMRGGFVKTRPGFKGIPLTFKAVAPGAAETIEARFATGRYQGSYNYRYGRDSFIIVAVSGYIHKIDLARGEVTDITPTKPDEDDPTNPSTLPDPHSSLINVFYFQQAEQYLVIQDGRNPAIIFDGTNCRRSNFLEDEVPVGTAMAYGGGRLWVANGREFVAGDIVGGPTEVIQFTENTYIAEGGAFAVPLDTGNITAMKFMNQPDSSLGQGELLVHTSEAVFAVNVPTSRDEWKNVSYPTVRIVAISYGSVSDRSCALVNSDMFYRAPDGIRSYISSRREWQEYGQIPVSRELGEYITTDVETSITETVSSVLFDNRLLTTVTAQNSSQGTHFKGLAVLDFDLVGGTGAKAPAAWEGLWTGLNFLQILNADIEGESRCFVFHKDDTCGIQLWELTRTGKKDVSGDDSYSISCYVESPSYSFENPFELKKLEYGEMWIDQLEGQVSFDIKYKPNQYPAWVDWNTFVECAKTDNCDPPAGECLTLQNYKPQYRSRIRLPQPADDCETSVSAQMRNGYEMSVRIGWNGHTRIKGFRLHAYPVIEEPYGGCGSTTPCV